MAPNATEEGFKEHIARLSTFLISDELSEIVILAEEKVKEKAVVDKLRGISTPHRQMNTPSYTHW